MTGRYLEEFAPGQKFASGRSVQGCGSGISATNRCRSPSEALSFPVDPCRRLEKPDPQWRGGHG